MRGFDYIRTYEIGFGKLGKEAIKNQIALHSLV